MDIVVRSFLYQFLVDQLRDLKNVRELNQEENICPTPGMKIRSQGQGRGLATGKGRGPIGRNIKGLEGGFRI